MRKITEVVRRAKEIALKEAENLFKIQGLNLKIIDVEWVSEYGTKILRITADSQNGLSIDEATSLNEAISLALDQEDFINEEYMLEVSSVGLEKELKSETDLDNALNEYVYCDLKTPIIINQNNKVHNVNNLEGYLKENRCDSIIIDYNDKGRKKALIIEKTNIKLIRLAIKF